MRKIYYLILFLSFVNTAFSQVTIEWQKTIGGDTTEYFSSIHQTTDGGYILGGYSLSNLSGDKTENSNGSWDFWIIKTDALGYIQWQNTIGGNLEDNLHSIQQTNDGGYILGGRSKSNISGDKTENSKGVEDYWIIKIDSIGKLEWQKTIGGSSFDYLYSVKQTNEGGYILAGHSLSNISGDKTENCKGNWDYWIVKTDSLGNIQWEKTIGGSGADLLYSIEQTAEGGYFLGGHSSSNISGDKTENSYGLSDYWIVKIDSSGNIQCQKTIGGSHNDRLYAVLQISDGGYILGGQSESNISGNKTENSNGVWDYWIIKTDAMCNILWQKTIGGSDGDFLRSIQHTLDGGYIIGGYSLSNVSGDKSENNNGMSDYWIVKIDSIGIIQWQKTIGGGAQDFLQYIEQINDGSYILGGHSYSNISGDKTENTNGALDFWILKISIPSSIDQLNSTVDLLIYPNPTTSELNISFNLDKTSQIKIELFNSLGQLVKTITNEKLHAGEYKINFSTGNISPGIYHLKFAVDGNEFARKVVKM